LLTMTYPHKIVIKDLPIPRGSIWITIETDNGEYTTTQEYFATKEEFLNFFEPIVKKYEELKNE